MSLCSETVEGHCFGTMSFVLSLYLLKVFEQIYRYVIYKRGKIKYSICMLRENQSHTIWLGKV